MPPKSVGALKKKPLGGRNEHSRERRACGVISLTAALLALHLLILGAFVVPWIKIHPGRTLPLCLVWTFLLLIQLVSLVPAGSPPPSDGAMAAKLIAGHVLAMGVLLFFLLLVDPSVPEVIQRLKTFRLIFAASDPG
jgi:hypothetical protein